MRRRNRDRGFTLIELLIVVTIILIIAAFTIPKLTKSTIPAHETSAIASIRAINEAEMIYASSHPDLGFTADLAMLGGTTHRAVARRPLITTWPAAARAATPSPTRRAKR